MGEFDYYNTPHDSDGRSNSIEGFSRINYARERESSPLLKVQPIRPSLLWTRKEVDRRSRITLPMLSSPSSGRRTGLLVSEFQGVRPHSLIMSRE